MSMRALLAGSLLFLAGEGHAACAGRDLYADLKVKNPAAFASVEAAANAVPNSKGLLWKIEGASAEASYLFGTIHITDTRVVTLAPEVDKAFAQSRRLAVEIETLNDPAIMADMAKEAVAQEGGTLAGFPEEARADLNRAAHSRGIPSEALNHFRQWFLLMMFALPACEMQVAANPANTLDGSLIERAKAQGREVIGLETPDEQISLFKNVDPGLLTRNLVITARYDHLSADMFESMIKAYLDRDIARIEPLTKPAANLTDAEYQDSQAFTRVLTDKRNETMTQRALPHLRKGGVFIAVGALHLPGENGLVELFRKSGLTLTRVW
jgi:uncharacterized protein YbaP (TraB family)